MFPEAEIYFSKARKAAIMAESQLEAENEANNQVNMKEIEDKKITEKIITMGLSIKEVISYLKIYFLISY